MKITANIPDELIKDVKDLAGAPTLTEAMIKALSEWVASKGMRLKHREIREKPLEFKDISAEDLRKVNRQK